MGFYAKFILPHLINVAMRNKDATRLRAEIIPASAGRVLEIGIGSGHNLQFYSSRVQRLQAVEPSRELLEMAGKKTGLAPFPVELIAASAEEIPVEDQSVDTVVTTWTLCSIPDTGKALAEMRRVLKPGGELIFVEHGLAPDAKVRAWQNRFNRPWKALAGGCNLNRPIEQLISSAGFKILKLETNYLRRPRMLTFTYKGAAQKR